MALAGRESETIIDYRSNTEKAAKKANFDAGEHLTLGTYPGEAALLYQIQQMQEDIIELRRYIISAELLVASSGGSLPTRAPARGLLWNDRGTVKIG
tara:strand:- start:31 stop:321 length:291 start_codon:yes stop_codon:yes gene_type:complete